MPRLSHAIANIVPSTKTSWVLSGRLQRAKKIVTPIIASGHHPQGGKLKPTSKPEVSAATLRAREEVLNSLRLIVIETDLRYEAKPEVARFFRALVDVMRPQGCLRLADHQVQNRRQLVLVL